MGDPRNRGHVRIDPSARKTKCSRCGEQHVERAASPRCLTCDIHLAFGRGDSNRVIAITHELPVFLIEALRRRWAA